MHLPGYPHFYVKNGKRRAVYFTGEARDLTAQGWIKEGAAEVAAAPEVVVPAPEVAVPAPAVEVDEPEVETSEEPAFELMTRVELLAYAESKGIDLPNNALKADLIEACRQIAA